MRLFKPTRLAFGIKSATGIFQRAIENKLKGLKHTVVRVDNTLVGTNRTERIIKELKELSRTVEQFEKYIYCVEGERFET